jgi:aryl-alcohol dehydrogenase-like predicted oxidoreductase
MDDRSLGEGRVRVPVVGLGTWQRLEAAAAAGRHRELIGTAVTAGIRLSGTSPMYGDAERLLAGAPGGRRGEVFIAGKIWTPSAPEGAAQLARAAGWYGGRAGLMQIHNLVSLARAPEDAPGRPRPRAGRPDRRHPLLPGGLR